MANEYYDSTGYPQTGASGSSASMRAELDSVEAGFNKLPTLTANGNKLVKVNSAGTGLETTSVISDDGTNATVTGDLTIAGGNVGVDADSMHAIPNVAADTLTLNAATQTLTNKTIVAADNAITTAASGNLAATELNAALAELQTDVDTREKSINAAAAKATPVDADTLGVIDSADTSILKKVTWANVKATLKAYFDTIYISVGNFAASGANSDITSLSALSTPLSVAQGGTGADTNAGTAYALKGANSDITSLTACTNITAAAVTVATDDKVLIQDTSDSDKLKTVLVSALMPSGSIATSGYTQNTNKILGRTTASTGAIEEITVGSGLTLSAGNLSASSTGLTLGTPVDTTSGSAVDYGSLPAGIKQITINFDRVSSSAGTFFGVRIGTGGSPDNTGYTGGSGAISTVADTTVGTANTSGFNTESIGVGALLSGSITLTLLDPTSNIWVASGVLTANAAAHNTLIVSGRKALSGALDIVRIYPGAGTFDNGSVNIAYLS
jgi:hypothetical protein